MQQSYFWVYYNIVYVAIAERGLNHNCVLTSICSQHTSQYTCQHDVDTTGSLKFPWKNETLLLRHVVYNIRTAEYCPFGSCRGDTSAARTFTEESLYSANL